MLARKTIIVFLSSLLVLGLYACHLSKRKAGHATDDFTYELVKDWPQLPKGYVTGNPTGIGIDRNQNVFVFIRAGRVWSDRIPDTFISANTILELDGGTGAIRNSWGANRFIMPHGLTVDKDDHIWVTDVGLHQVFKFNHSGKLLMVLGTAGVSGNDSTHFNLPTDVAVAPDGSVYISDGYGNSRVVKFSASGQYLFSWGSFGSGKGEFNTPHAIDLDDKGNVYVADRENSRIQVFDPSGKFLRTYAEQSFGKLYALCIDKWNKRLAAVDYIKVDNLPKGSDVILFSGHPESKPKQFGRSCCYDGPVCRYHDIAIDKQENIYVGDILGNRIQKFRKVGK